MGGWFGAKLHVMTNFFFFSQLPTLRFVQANFSDRRAKKFCEAQTRKRLPLVVEDEQRTIAKKRKEAARMGTQVL